MQVIFMRTIIAAFILLICISCTGPDYSVVHNDGVTYLKGFFDNKDSIMNDVWEEWMVKEKYKRFEWTFENDEKNGPYKAFRKNGSIEASGFYKKGTLSDTLSYFNERGKCYKKEIWKPSPSFTFSTLVETIEID